MCTFYYGVKYFKQNTGVSNKIIPEAFITFKQALNETWLFKKKKSTGVHCSFNKHVLNLSFV